MAAGAAGYPVGMQPDPVVRRTNEIPGRRIGLIVVVLIVAFFAALELLGFRNTMPPRSRTAAIMTETKARILRHAATHGEPPATLEELAPPEGAAAADGTPPAVVDGWGIPLLYETDGERVWLRSLAHDVEVGGRGREADMEGAFPLKDAAGAWLPPDTPWERDPLGRAGEDGGA